MDAKGGSPKAEHLCVLVHGLWGTPEHMNTIAKTLRSQHSPDELYLLLAKRNSGSFTYDGIELGGERVCAEIEEELRLIESQGGKLKKLSIVGYSMGGLVARYAVGLLHAKGLLDGLECTNFITFATPHLGVRSPTKGWPNYIYNVMGARILSKSGRQLFTIDEFRDTGRPLLSVLADPDSIFMSGLRRFKRHSLYANIVNDRTAVYYTTGIQKTDPFRELEKVNVNYLDGWEEVILDADHPCDVKKDLVVPSGLEAAKAAGRKTLKRAPFMVLLSIFIPVFLATCAVQTIRSSSRIRTHEMGKSGLKLEDYRLPLWIKEMRGEVEHAYEAINNTQSEEFLASGDEDDHMKPQQRETMQRERRMSVASQPTLALTPDQFQMVASLDSLGWRKYPVWIHHDRHSHGAIIVRFEKKTFDEGHVVLKHFAQEEFSM